MNNTEVIFENIEQRIITEIENAHYAIFVSVAWFTNKKLFNALLEKAKQNCYVSIIIQLDEINSQSGIDYSQIQVGRSECFKISKDAELLHDKFCVIDFKKVITGSYNWTYKAPYNSENILILNDPSVATQYISRFEQQKAKFNTSSTQISPIASTTSNHNSTNIQKNNTIISSPPRRCRLCGRNLGSNDEFCSYCGTKQSVNNIDNFIICNKCSHKQVPPILSRGTKYCTNCGNIIREQELLPNKCPICKNEIDRSVNRNFCTYCGLADNIYTLCSDEILKTGKYRLNLHHVRPEFISFEQYQRCYKCNAINLWGVNYCRSCGEDISMHAKDKYEHEWVDIGLSVLWSSRMSKGCYRWMDKERFPYDGYFPYLRNEKRVNKDTVSELFGNKWRMPTKQEVEELIELCEWEKVAPSGPFDYSYLKITGPNGNHIRLSLEKLHHSVYTGLRFWISSTDENHKPFAFRCVCPHSSGPLIKRGLRIRSEGECNALYIVPVADKKWKGCL